MPHWEKSDAAVGPYDNLGIVVHMITGADAIIMFILGGVRGSGSVVMIEDKRLREVPGLLRSLADSIAESVVEQEKRDASPNN